MLPFSCKHLSNHGLLLTNLQESLYWRKQEKKKKMKESTPPPLKERKEIRKEGLGLVITTTTTIRAIFRVQNEEMWMLMSTKDHQHFWQM